MTISFAIDASKIETNCYKRVLEFGFEIAALQSSEKAAVGGKLDQ
jgi:hypothetical protein